MHPNACQSASILASNTPGFSRKLAERETHDVKEHYYGRPLSVWVVQGH